MPDKINVGDLVQTTKPYGLCPAGIVGTITKLLGPASVQLEDGSTIYVTLKDVCKPLESVRMPFKDAPIGARLKCPGVGGIFVKLNSYPEGLRYDGLGLVCSWHGNVTGHQSFCCWVDEGHNIDFDTVVELI